MLLGLGVIFLVYSIDRFRHIFGSEKVKGEFVFYVDEMVNGEKLSFPIIQYVVRDSAYQFKAKENTFYEPGQEVPVLLAKGDPDQPLLYTPGSFWFFPLLYFILPVLLWSSFSLSYIGSNEVVIISFSFPFFKKDKN